MHAKIVTSRAKSRSGWCHFCQKQAIPDRTHPARLRLGSKIAYFIIVISVRDVGFRFRSRDNSMDFQFQFSAEQKSPAFADLITRG